MKSDLTSAARRHLSYSKTDRDRREELTPVMRREDCEAFLEIRDDTIFFCVARGDGGQKPLPVVEVVPWVSFGNFEEGSHKQWFRSKGAPDQMPDWDVIIAQSSVPRVVNVAESMNDHASMVELLTLLQQNFAGPARDKAISAFEEAKREAAPGGVADTPTLPKGF